MIKTNNFNPQELNQISESFGFVNFSHVSQWDPAIASSTRDGSSQLLSLWSSLLVIKLDRHPCQPHGLALSHSWISPIMFKECAIPEVFKLWPTLGWQVTQDWGQHCYYRGCWYPERPLPLPSPKITVRWQWPALSTQSRETRQNN